MKFYYRVTLAAVTACFFVLSFYAAVYKIRKYGVSSNSLLWKTQHWTNDNKVHVEEQLQFEADTDFKTIDILEEIQLKSALRLNDKGVRRVKKILDRMLPLKVIVIPHSHNDPGWLKTVDRYFEEQTKAILDNMLEKLKRYPDMTFVWAESVFLSMWWIGLDEQKRDVVRSLIERRQLEIVVGSWVVPDEANPHYFALIDQMIEGHQWLVQNIGVKPRNTWALDPFGYSSVLPYLYQRAGMENLVTMRAQAAVKERLERSRALEFRWRQHWDQGNATDILTLLMPYLLYTVQDSCGPDVRVCIQFSFGKVSRDNTMLEPIHSGNVDRQAKLLLEQYQKKANLFRHNVVLVPLGEDFAYKEGAEWDHQYGNYTALFNYMNSMKEWNVNARFGTIQDYFEEVRTSIASNGQTVEKLFPSLSGDFFPYYQRKNEYWTGYFSTRPFLKGLGRDVEVYLRAAEIFNSLAIAKSRTVKYQATPYNFEISLADLTQVRRSLGLFQHHDAITGTCRAEVAKDYENRLIEALFLARKVIKNVVAFLTVTTNADDDENPGTIIKVLEAPSNRTLTPLDHVIHVGTNSGIRVAIVNNIAHRRQEVIQIVVDMKDVQVTDVDGHIVTSQVSPVWNNKQEQSACCFHLTFIADLLPLSITYHDITVTDGDSAAKQMSVVKTYNSDNLIDSDMSSVSIIENEHFCLEFSIRSGELLSLRPKRGSKDQQKISLQLLAYTSRRGGPYVFSPAGAALPINASINDVKPPTVRLITGPVYSEVRVIYSFVEHVLRLVKTSGPLGTAIEVNNIVDLQKVMYNRELVMRLSTTINNGDVFYTDQNGFDIIRRKRFSNLPPEAAYYPSTAFTYIQDRTSRLSLLTSQPVGVSSQRSGSLEVMLDRRLKLSDHLGLEEGILDNRRTYLRFYILWEFALSGSRDTNETIISTPSLLANLLVHHMRNYPILLLTRRKTEFVPYVAMNTNFPCDVILVNLRTIDDTSNHAALILHKLKLSATYVSFASVSVGCSLTNSFVITQLFQDLSVQSLVETSLSLLHDKQPIDPDEPIVLDQMHLYTFRITFKFRPVNKFVMSFH